jgi:hypothetical protein
MRLAGDVREESSGVITILREIRLSLRQESGFNQAATAAFKSSHDRNRALSFRFHSPPPCDLRMEQEFSFKSRVNGGVLEGSVRSKRLLRALHEGGGWA